MKLLLFIFLLSLSSQNPTSAQCTESQKASLLTLFPSPQSLSWTPTTDCCFWNGVTCDPATGHVTSLDLTNRSISGPLNSTAFTSLPSLQSLNLSLNLFNSSIPDGVFSLPNLTSLNLSNSGFYGRVPGEISQLKRLVSLDLSTSPLTGFFPLFPVSLLGPDLGFLAGNLSGLREVYLYGVAVSSPVPESLVGLVDLRILRLGSCNLTGRFPGEMFKLQNLEILDVSNNPLLTVKFAPRFITMREYLSSSDSENEKSSMMEMKKELLLGWNQPTHSVLEVRNCSCSPTQCNSVF